MCCACMERCTPCTCTCNVNIRHHAIKYSRTSWYVCAPFFRKDTPRNYVCTPNVTTGYHCNVRTYIAICIYINRVCYYSRGICTIPYQVSVCGA